MLCVVLVEARGKEDGKWIGNKKKRLGYVKKKRKGERKQKQKNDAHEVS